jgi:tRNA A-37 threonylcarbamoyl transferase component Bud32
MDNNKSKYQYVFSMKLAGTLMTKGFKILRISKLLEDNTKDVYVFEKSAEIQREIDKYIKAKGENGYAIDKRGRSKTNWQND